MRAHDEARAHADGDEQAPGERLADAVSKGIGLLEDGSSSPTIDAPPSATITQRSNASLPASAPSAQAQPRQSSPDRQPSHGRRVSSGDSFSSVVDERVCWNRLRLPFFNVLCMSVAFMLLFSAFNTVQGFCTSLLPDGLGNISLTVCYATVVCVVIFAPAIVGFLGEPLAMLLGAGCYCLYMSSLIASDRTLLLCCSVVLGFGGSILWVSSACYLTRCSAEHERGRNTGIFWSLFQMSAVFGNLSAYAIFQHVTSTQLFTVLCVVGCCGAAMLLALKPLPERFYPKDNSIYASGAVGAGMGRRNSTTYSSASATTAAAPTASEVSIHVSSSGSAHTSSDVDDDAESDGLRNRDPAVPSTILPLPPTTSVHPLVVPLPVVLVPVPSSTAPVVAIAVTPSLSSLVREVLGMFGDSRLLMLMPLMVFLGLEFSFWNGEFPQLLPRESIGLVLCTAGVMEVAGGVGLGWVASRWGRSAALLLGSSVFSIGLYLSSTHLMFHNGVAPAWQDVKGYAYVSAACFGLGDSAFNTQVYALIGSEFSRSGESRLTSAFACFNFLVNVGMATGFFYGLAVPMHSAKGTRTQVAVQLVMLVIASTGFVMCERRCEQRRNEAANARRNSSSHRQDPSTAHSVQVAYSRHVRSAQKGKQANWSIHSSGDRFRTCILRGSSSSEACLVAIVLCVEFSCVFSQRGAVDPWHQPALSQCAGVRLQILLSQRAAHAPDSESCVEHGCCFDAATSRAPHVQLCPATLCARRQPARSSRQLCVWPVLSVRSAAVVKPTATHRYAVLLLEFGSQRLRSRGTGSGSVDHFQPADGSSASRKQRGAVATQFIKAAGSMEQLEGLQLAALYDEALGFAPLAALKRIKSLSITTPSDQPVAVPSDEQVAALRELHSLEHFTHNFTNRNGTLRLWLQAPTPPLRLSEAFVASSGAASLVPLLQPLADLVALDVECTCGDVKFLLSLPRIVRLTLRQAKEFAVSSAEQTSIIATLQRCSQLTSLTLDRFAFTSAHMEDLLPMLPLLSHLRLHQLYELTSLSFLNTAALASSLTSLHIISCTKVPSDEIRHLIRLRLRSLFILTLREPVFDELKGQLRVVCSQAVLH